MNDRERLIKLFLQPMYVAGFYDKETVAKAYADRILADGWIKPPYKVGDTVWAIAITGKIYKYTVNGFHYFEDKHFMFGAYRIREDGKKVNPTWQDSEIGKTVFLTREEAEKALAERRDSQ